jgi:hypothetical protein
LPSFLTDIAFSTVPFSSSASNLSLASYLPDSMQGMPDKDVPPSTTGTLEFNKWYEGFISDQKVFELEGQGLARLEEATSGVEPESIILEVLCSSI